MKLPAPFHSCLGSISPALLGTALVCACSMLMGTQLKAQSPQLGAQIWIEPTQTREQIDGWFRTLREQHMPVARLFLIWSDLEASPGRWDFTQYDEAFAAAEREHVRIVATLTPSGRPPFRRGDGSQGRGVVASIGARADAAIYVRTVVEHYRKHPALDTWLLINEPGQQPEPQELAVAEFPSWLQTKYRSIGDLNRSWGSAYGSFDEARPPVQTGAWNPRPGMDWSDFWRLYQTRQLAWLAEQVRLSDTTHPLHVNPHALVSNLADVSDNLPTWRTFLDTMGCSIHPAWHFGLLSREQYALGVSYVNDLVAGSMQPKPYWVTELQGGNNISSGARPMNPTAEEITQWVWTSVGAGAKRVIFWLLNARSAGVEAGEWSMMDFQQRPSDRLLAASVVAKQIEAHREFFDHAQPIQPDISILISLDTMTLESHTPRADHPARGKDAQVLAALGFYEAISRLGVPPAIRHMDDYEWEAPGAGRVVVLPDVRALSRAQIGRMIPFAKSGGTILLSGLTGFYDTEARAWPVPDGRSQDQPISELTGARMQEISVSGKGASLKLDGSAEALPIDLWESTLEILPNTQTHSVGSSGEKVFATERRFPQGGRVLWIPASIDIGAWLHGEGALANLLNRELGDVVQRQPIRFERPQPGCLLRVMRNGSAYLTVVTNGGLEARITTLRVPSNLKPEVVAGPAPQGSSLALGPLQTSVLLWRVR